MPMADDFTLLFVLLFGWSVLILVTCVAPSVIDRLKAGRSPWSR